MKMNNTEEFTKYNLSLWLKKFIPNIEIRWEKKNNFGFSIFKCKGSRKKPDLLFWIPHHKYGKYMISAVEVKNGDHSFNLIDSVKIVDYYVQAQSGETIYYVDEQQIKPKYFLIATKYSTKGYLLKRDSLTNPIKKGEKIGYSWQPDFEYQNCFTFTRMLWKKWKDIKDPKYCLGVLLSDKLNGGEGHPSIFIQKYNWNKNKWNPPHYFWKIGDNFD